MEQTVDLSCVLREQRAKYDDDLSKRTDIKSIDQYPTPPHHHHSRCTRALAWETLRTLGFWDIDRVLNKHGVERAMAAVGYVRACPDLKKPGAIVRLMLDGGDPIPLPPPTPENKHLSGRYRHLTKH